MQALIEEMSRWPHVPELWGKTLAERDALFRRYWLPVRQAIDGARVEKRAASFDASAAGFVFGGDTYETHADGRVTRDFSRLSFSSQASAFNAGAAPIDDVQVLARLHAIADVSPTATNWQPHRVLFMTEADAQKAGVPLSDPRGAGLLFFRRPRYESLLGDILDLYGMQASAFEEWVDPGIYIETIRLAAHEAGLAVAVVEAHAAKAQKATSLVAGGEIDSRHLPFLFLRFRRVAERRAGHFAELALSRSSQRVASPARDLALDALRDFSGDQTVWFKSSDAMVPAIGRAMFNALYGEGADTATKTGGRGGVLAHFSPEHAQAALQVGAEASVRAHDIGVYLRERLCEGGRYVIRDDGVLASARGEAMTYKHLLRMTKTFAAAMGTFFLQFHNTHPCVGVVLADKGEMGAFDAGARAARLLYFARAQGYAAIVKSGPIDLAEAGIEKALALRDGVRPALLVQVGWPLADEILGNGVRGLDQRERDLRPPRAHPLIHFFV